MVDARRLSSRRRDVRHGSVTRCASAVGEGAMAVMFVHRYLAGG
jgi:thioredoxin reductase (NADPH)